MKLASRLGRKGRRRRGILTFEWILLISLLVIGVIGGLTAVRNSLICELNELTGCIEAIACCDDDGSPSPPPGGSGGGHHGGGHHGGGHAGCTTCGNSSGDWWSGHGDW